MNEASTDERKSPQREVVAANGFLCLP